MKLPRYVRTIGNSDRLHYQRDYPTKLRLYFPKKTFSYPLDLKVSEATESKLAKAIARASEAYELQIKMIENSDPDAFGASELDMAVTEFLRKRQLSRGQHLKVAKDLDVSAEEERLKQQLQAHEEDYSDMVIPEFDDVVDKYNRGEKLTFEDRVTAEAWTSLHNRAKAKPKTLSSLWSDYAASKGIDTSSREGKRITNRWKRWLAMAGNVAISNATLDHIHDGLDAYVANRVAEGVSGASIRRELNDIVACLRYASKRYRFSWVIERPDVPKSKPKQRVVIKRSEQLQLVDYCVSTSGSEASVAACVLLMLQGAMMPSEIKRLTPERLRLSGELPLLLVDGETKTNARKRVVPIVLGVEFIAEHLPKALEWLNSTTESNHSHKIKKLLYVATGNDRLTGHCCRHTFKANCDSNGVSPTAAATIAGWSGREVGFSENMLNYGTDSLAQTEVVANLFKESQKIHQHLLKPIAANVVDIKRA
ncbi:hypothetical protein IMCC3088_322 [Aequoribacter fuscus]|uniref:Uncharacterized protein n=1 Tax=Aequoribacter fuscus TaxID=2518989 RepID=F3L5P2_9GAMM|nr:hypothetical protein [Aequoribacter fuscus]EGG28350.1 hypothetical protein IMCC3088_322 [Aequoribacter fuscus]QHJ87357.1 hypothetical protein EYZ66_03155 [Aequoribacter fuscus]